MATDDLLPLSYPPLPGQPPAGDMLVSGDLDQDQLLRELLNDNDLLSLLESDKTSLDPPTSSLYTPSLPTSYDTSTQHSLLNNPSIYHSSLNCLPDHNTNLGDLSLLQNSTLVDPSVQLSSPVGSEGCVSDFSSGQSPSWSAHSSEGAAFLAAPPNMAPAPPMLDQQQLMQLGMIAGSGDLETDLSTVGTTERHGSASSPSSSGGDVHIDLGDISSLGSNGGLSSSSERKMGNTTITEEEEKMLAEEGIYLPVDMPLTKAEEKHLKRVRRKIKNKLSAAESRKRKKNYVEGLEERVEKCTKMNRSLQDKVNNLEKENRSLATQLKRLQAFVAQCNPTKVGAGSCVMVVLLSFSLLMVHNLHLTSPDRSGMVLSSYSSRALLKVEADEFGNLVDPETRLVISIAGSQSPVLPPPWKCQTPSFDLFNSRHKG